MLSPIKILSQIALMDYHSKKAPTPGLCTLRAAAAAQGQCLAKTEHSID